MTLDINYTTTNPRNVDKLLETAIEEIQAGASAKVFTPKVTAAQKAGTGDATAEILAAAAEMVAAGGGTFVIDGALQCTSSIILPLAANIEFTPGSSILTRPGGTFISDALFLINCSNGTTWDIPYPNIRGYARNITVDNTANPSLVVGAMLLGTGIYVENIYTKYCHYNVHNVNEYIDQIRINGSMAAEPQGSLFPIELANTGDGLSIRATHSYKTGTTSKNIKLTACQGGEIQGCIGGEIYLNQCSAVKVHGCHQETGQLTIDGSDCSIEDSYFWIRDIPSIKQISNSGGERRIVSIRNVKFMFKKNDLVTIPTAFDIQVGTGYHTVIENCSRTWGTTANAYSSEKLGVFVANSAGTALTAWNNYAYIYSRRGEIDHNQLVSSVTHINTGTGTPALFNSTTTSNGAQWQLATATYYYQAQLVYDAGRRLGVNSSSAEASFALTANGNCPLFVIGPGFGTRTQNCFVRLYRGTAAGSYDSYVDLPIMAARQITDRGDYCSGFAWIAKSPGVVFTLFDTTSLTLKGATVEATLATVPPTAVGTFVVGDVCNNQTPTAGGFRGTICTAAGTPGTHKTYGAISP